MRALLTASVRCRARITERPQLLGFGERLWRVACEPVNFQSAQDTILFEDQDTAELVLLAKDEVGDWVNARRRSGLALNAKVDAGTTTWTLPRRDLSKLELLQKRRRFRAGVFQHPAYEAPFVIRKLSIAVAHVSRFIICLPSPSRDRNDKLQCGVGR